MACAARRVTFSFTEQACSLFGRSFIFRTVYDYMSTFSFSSRALRWPVPRGAVGSIRSRRNSGMTYPIPVGAGERACTYSYSCSY